MRNVQSHAIARGNKLTTIVVDHLGWVPVLSNLFILQPGALR